MAVNNNSDLTIYKIYIDEAAYMAEVRECINIGFDILSAHMYEVMCTVIQQCSQASTVMKNEACKNVKEISRSINNSSATIEVGIDEGAIGGGEQGYVRVMVTLHGNGEVWARPGASAWTKDVNTKRKNNVLTEYRLPYFEQSDHSDTMMVSFEHDIEKYAKDCLERITDMIKAIDISKYLVIGG